MTGTLINALSVIVGSSIGLFMRSRLTERYRKIVINAISLVTLLIGLKLSLEVKSIFWVLLSLILGGLIGELNQGSLTLFARVLSPVFDNAYIASNFYATGGIMLIGIGFNLLGLTRIKTINYIFALILVVIFSKVGGIL